MAKKESVNKFALAVKDADGFLAELEKGSVHMPGRVEEYKELISSADLKINNLKDLNKFIRKVGLSRGECHLYWEGLLTEGYTLLAAESPLGEAKVIGLCDNKHLKFLSTARV